jgi:hypothetical protein
MNNMKILGLSGAATASFVAMYFVFFAISEGCARNKPAYAFLGLGLGANGVVSVSLVLKELSSSSKEEDDNNSAT